MKFRTDKDSLGSVKVPYNAFYGPFTGRAIKQYSVTGQKSHKNLIRSFVMIKRSAAVANMKTKSINKKQGTAIVNACDKILSGKYQDQFVVDMINSGAGTAFNMNVNEVIANVALAALGKSQGQYQFLHPHDHVTTSPSTNATYPTAMPTPLPGRRLNRPTAARYPSNASRTEYWLDYFFSAIAAHTAPPVMSVTRPVPGSISVPLVSDAFNCRILSIMLAIVPLPRDCF